jgi:hypothetical protein
MLLRCGVPIGEFKIETRSVTARDVEAFKAALYCNLTFLVERNNVIAVRQALGWCRNELSAEGPLLLSRGRYIPDEEAMITVVLHLWSNPSRPNRLPHIRFSVC